MSTPQLTRKLALLDPVRTSDGAGGFDTTWTELGHVWAELRFGTGRERAQDAAIVARTPLKITVRAAPVGALSRPRPDQRFQDGSRMYRILSVSEVMPEARYLLCQAEEEVLG